VLHIESGAATMSSVTGILRSLGYELQTSVDHAAPAHRFLRGKEQIDVMVADHLAPKMIPSIGGRKPFQVTGGAGSQKGPSWTRFIGRSPLASALS
jgi:CheY-like chemotaxis protein